MGRWGRAAAWLAAVAVIALPGLARAAGCPEARALLLDGRFQAAEDRARGCLYHAGADPDTELILARALAYQQRYDQALPILQDLSRRHPGDPSYRIWAARVQAWSGDLDPAWERVRDLPAEAVGDPEDLRFLADLAWWRHDSAEAARRYDRYLERVPGDRKAVRNRGIARRDAKDVEGALRDFDALCATGDDPEDCLLGDTLRIAEAPYTLLLRLDHSFVFDRPDWYSLGVLFGARLSKGVRAGLGAEFRPRPYVRDPFADLFMDLWTSVDAASWATIRVAGGIAVEPVYSPDWSIQIEPTFRPVAGLELGLLYWRMQFDDPVNVLAPAAFWEWGRLSGLVRYYLAVTDSRDVMHAAFAKLQYTVTWPLQVYVAAGGGNKSDYLEPSAQPGTETHWTVGGGASYLLTWQWRLVVDLLFREERLALNRFRMMRLSVGGEVRF